MQTQSRKMSKHKASIASDAGDKTLQSYSPFSLRANEGRRPKHKTGSSLTLIVVLSTCLLANASAIDTNNSYSSISSNNESDTQEGPLTTTTTTSKTATTVSSSPQTVDDLTQQPSSSNPATIPPPPTTQSSSPTELVSQATSVQNQTSESQKLIEANNRHRDSLPGIIVNNHKSGEPKLLLLAPMQMQFVQQPLCNLGNDTYQLGERWNPNLPPFGVQVCVQCECIVRQRKSCYEAKVTCRRIINECPIIGSCPDGNRPITIPGQCCKLCPSSLPTTTEGPENASSSSSWTTTGQMVTTPPPSIALTLDRMLYRNERIKEFQSMAKNLPACPKRADSGDKLPNQLLTGSSNSKLPSQKGSKNDLNGIEPRRAFKSLDAQSSYVTGSGKGPGNGPNHHRNGAGGLSEPDYHYNAMGNDHQQHPNDVQSGGNGNQFSYDTRFTSQYPTTTSTKRPLPPNPLNNICTLGSDTFQIGDRWNPILPPNGVQVCVQCNCIIRQRRNCYEARLTCRRINNDCPIIDLCPDGKRPITLAGQCCKSCPTSSQQQAITSTNSTGTQDFNSTTLTASTTLATLSNIQLERIQKNDRVLREYQSIMKTMPACLKNRDGSDGNNYSSNSNNNNNNSNYNNSSSSSNYSYSNNQKPNSMNTTQTVKRSHKT